MLATQERLETEQIVAVENGPVTTRMFTSASLSIAFDQPEATSDVRNGFISSRSLASVLCMFGATGRDITTFIRT